MNNTYLADAIKASFTHKKVGKYLRNNIIKPGVSLKDIALITENKIKEYINFDSENPLLKGIAFPVGLSLNNCAAHYTPNNDDLDIFLKDDDILKIDYGVHFNGTIIDSAFTVHFNEKYNEFIQISKDVTDFAVKQCGPDVILGEIGKEIEEYVHSCQLEIDNKIVELKTMRDLSGHLISKYTIHAGKAVPNTSIYYPVRMIENEFYAVEPFITTGNGISIEKNNNSHYMIKNKKSIKSNNLLYDIIHKNFYTLPFCKKWLIELYLEEQNRLNNIHDINIFNNSLNNLVKENILQEYPPLYDIEGSIISQFEHTIFIRDKGIINLTKNNFY
jgi:methionyl aminopeptidase